MLESNQEGYRTLGWIVNKSEQGIYLAVADEEMQSEIARIYRRGAVGVYDYKQHPGAYSFRDLQEWVSGLPGIKTFFLSNFHLAVQNEESLKRLNFSRDMLEGLGKNLIFLVTPYWDDRLAKGAYDFYSFIKLRIMFHNYEKGHEDNGELLSLAAEPEEEREWNAEEAKQKLAEAYELLEQAREERDRAHYRESVELLLKAREIKEKLLGPEHLEVAWVDHELADAFYYQGKYGKAEELYERCLRIKESVLGEEHPDTAASYNNLAGVYESQGKYEKAEELYEKSLRIREGVLGEEHPDTATSYNNLAYVYERQGKYKLATLYYFKAYNIFLARLGTDHPHTQTVYNNLKYLFGLYNLEGNFEQWIAEHTSSD